MLLQTFYLFCILYFVRRQLHRPAYSASMTARSGP